MPQRVPALASLFFVAALQAQATEFVASLDGAQPVPPTASAVKGKLQLLLDTTNNTVVYKLLTGTFSTAVPTGGVTIRRAASGANGAAVVALTGSGTLWAGVTRAITTTEIADLRAGLWYVNVQTAAFPGGEIRGQIAAALLPTAFGTGCVGTNTKTPTIGARSFACANNSVFRLTLANAKESSTAFLLVGTSKTDWSGIPLPFDLTPIGMAGCTAYCNDTGIGGPGTFTDATGAAFIPILLPYDNSIVGATLYSQWVVLDPGATLLGFTTSNALEWKVQ